ncbi:MAG: diguanylate cyclase [Candidatus Electrothrix sp. ATG2]|nr:diguanylate cyclase [Candidatus Electrothrix sp. ATG2]
MKTIFNILDKRRSVFIWWLSTLTVVIVCYLNILLDGYIDLAPLLITPVLLASWYGSSKAGVSIALFSSLSLFITRRSIVSSTFEGTSSTCDALVVLFVYLFIAIIVTNFRKVHGVEVVAADTDNLTGVHSVRSFYAGLANEILRSSRYGHIFSLAYIDIDNFKSINDAFGHSTGDKLLVEISGCLASSFRTTDTIARIGGDEFICLLPETEQSEAKNAILKAKSFIAKTMCNNKWEVSLSVGVVTFETLPVDVHEAVKIADKLMYTVKNNKKNAIAYKVWHGVA